MTDKKLLEDEHYFSFVHELAMELASEAWESFRVSGAGSRRQETFLHDVAQALTAHARFQARDDADERGKK